MMSGCKAVFFDLEFTAWEGSVERRWLAPGEFTELVQIGAIRADARTLEAEAEFECLTRPRLNKVLSAYFVALTGIDNDQLAARGVDFERAYRDFVEFADGAPIVAFGRDDLIFEANIRLYGIAGLPPLPRHLNITPWLRNNGLDTKGKHACDVGPLAGAPFSGRRHDALDDARSVLAGVRRLVERGAASPFLP
jgi:inhibitor of KinA sporulation pathway (predicted exonuclease)